MVIRRSLVDPILEALSDTPVVFLNGARQTGKSTLCRNLTTNGDAYRYLTLDQAGVLAAARNDPAGFVAGLDRRVVLDEVQRAPDLFLAIKAEVDRNRQPGRFLLTGSASILLLPRISESLAGRMEILTLWPLSQSEIAGRTENFVDAVFADGSLLYTGRGIDRADLTSRVALGGYPAAIQRPYDLRRRAWFGSYLVTILQRDVRDWSNVEDLTALPRLLTLLASRAGSLLNYADVSRGLAMPQTTLKRYMTLLQTAFLVETLPAWSSNLGRQLVKAAKLYLLDTGLLCSLLGITADRLRSQPDLLGPALENFVVMELRKQAGWSRLRPQMFHFRLQTGAEVDVLLEDARGRLVGIEVKASATVGASDFKGLRTLAELTGRRFRRGIVLYTGSELVPFGPKLHAVPLDALWS